MNLKLSSFLLNKGYFYLLLLFCFIIPFLPNFAPLLTGVFFVCWLLEGNFKNRFLLLKKEKFRLWMLLPVAFFLYHCIQLPFRVFFSDNNVSAELFDIQTKIFFIALPLLFCTLPLSLFNKSNINKYLWAFIIGFTAYIIYTLGKASYLCIFEQANPSVQFFFTSLSPRIHPSYASMFGVFAICFIMYLKNISVLKKQQFILNILFFVFPIYIFMLSSRAGIICLGIAYFFIFLNFFKQKKSVVHLLILILLVGSSVTTGILLSKKSKIAEEKYEETVKITNTKEGQPSNTRIVLWEASAAGISKHFFWGVGYSKVKETIATEALKNNEDSFNLNSHNQFLQSFLALGIIGFLILVSCFAYPFILGFKQKFYLYTLFSILTGVNNLVESMLERSVGNLFFTFFFCFLLLFCYSKKEELFASPLHNNNSSV